MTSTSFQAISSPKWRSGITLSKRSGIFNHRSLGHLGPSVVQVQKRSRVVGRMVKTDGAWIKQLGICEENCQLWRESPSLIILIYIYMQIYIYISIQHRNICLLAYTYILHICKNDLLEGFPCIITLEQRCGS